MHPGSAGAAADQGSNHISGSLLIQENPLFKKLYNPICYLSLSHSLYRHSGQDSVIVAAYILSLIPFSSLETVKVGHILKSGPHTRGIPFSSLSNHFSIQANLDHPGCAMATMRNLFLQ